MMIAVIGRFSSAAGHASRSSSRSSRDNPSALLLLSRRFSRFSRVLFCSVFFLSCIRFFCRIYESFLLLQSVIVIQQSTRIFHIIYHIIPYHTIASIHPSIHHFVLCLSLILLLSFCFRARQLYILRSSPYLLTLVSNTRSPSQIYMYVTSHLLTFLHTIMVTPSKCFDLSYTST